MGSAPCRYVTNKKSVSGRELNPGPYQNIRITRPTELTCLSDATHRNCRISLCVWCAERRFVPAQQPERITGSHTYWQIVDDLDKLFKQE